MSKWVRHLSAHGKRWKVVEHFATQAAWCVFSEPGSVEFYHYLPRSEYTLCDPPEEWEDVTAEYARAFLPLTIQELPFTLQKNDRLTYHDGLHNGPSFIIQRKKA